MNYGILICLLCYGVFSWLLGYFQGRNSIIKVGTPSASHNSAILSPLSSVLAKWCQDVGVSHIITCGQISELENRLNDYVTSE